MNIYTHYNEPLFDYIIIRETGEFSSEGYKTANLFGVNYEDESKEIPCGYIDCFKVSPSCQFDFHKTEVYLCSVRISRSQMVLAKYLLLIPILDRLLQLKIVINL